MDSIINRLTEIEETASSIVEHAEEEKAVLDKEYDEKRRNFDAELSEKTRERIQAIRDKLDRDSSEILDGGKWRRRQRDSGSASGVWSGIRSMPGIF